MACTPLGTTTPVLVLCKPKSGETGWDTGLNGNFDTIDALFTGASLLKVANGGTGAATLTNNGVLLGRGTSPVGATAVGATNTLLHGNTGADPSYSAVVEADITLADNTTNNVSTARHGFVVKAPGGTTQFFRSDATWAVPAASASKSILIFPFITLIGGSPEIVGAGISSTTAADRFIFLPAAGTIKNLYIRTGLTYSTTNTAVSVRVNGTNSALITSVNVNSANTTYTDLTHSVTVAAGDAIDLSIPNSTVGNLLSSWSLEFDPS